MISSFGEKSCNYGNMCFQRWTRGISHWWVGIDWRKVFHSIKGGLVLGLVSCVLLSKDVYNALGKNVIWAILTVVVVFECTVGATLMKGLNRGLGTIFAAFVGLVFDNFANKVSTEIEPYIVGCAVFIIGFLTTYLRSIPWIKAKYDYGMVMFSLTFSLVVVAGYRSPSTIDLVLDRMLTVLIGCLACLVVNVLIYPIWAGEDLHNLIVNNFEDLAVAIEESDMAAARRTSKILKGEPFNDPIYKGYKAVMISKQMEETLANFARWEPWHGRFGFWYPWNLCLQIGAILRHCSYSVCALHGCILSETQAPEALRQIVSHPCMRISSEASKALREMADSIKFCRKTHRSKEAISKTLHSAVNQLHISLDYYYKCLQSYDVSNSYTKEEVNPSMLPPYDSRYNPDSPYPSSAIEEHVCSHKCKQLTGSLSIATVVTLLIEIISCFDPLLKAVGELEEKGCFKNPEDSKVKQRSLKRYKTDKLMMQHASSHIHPF